MDKLPTGKFFRVSVPVPSDSLTDASVLRPFLIVTFPVGINELLGVTVTLNVTA